MTISCDRLPRYMNDAVHTTNSAKYKSSIFADIIKKYEFEHGGVYPCCLDIQVVRNGRETLIYQSKYCNEVLDRLRFGTYHVSATPMKTNYYSKIIEYSDDQEPTHDY